MDVREVHVGWKYEWDGKGSGREGCRVFIEVGSQGEHDCGDEEITPS